MLLEETTRIHASAREVFGFFETMEEQYGRWHPQHESFSWIAGDGLEVGAIARFEERIAGKPRRHTVRFTAVEQDRYIEFVPMSRVIRFLMPSISFTINSDPAGCDLTQRIRVRTGPIGAWLNRREFDAVREHMKEEGEHLKRLLEDEP